MKKRSVLAIAGVLVVTATAGGYAWNKHRKNPEVYLKHICEKRYSDRWTLKECVKEQRRAVESLVRTWLPHASNHDKFEEYQRCKRLHRINGILDSFGAERCYIQENRKY